MANTYGDITPRTAAFAAAKLLERAYPHMCMAKFGQQQPIPKNKTSTIKFRRYNRWAPSLTPLVEGVTPAADNISATDVTAVLAQYGRRTQITDVIADTHEDPVLAEYSEIMGEVAGQTQESIIYGVLRAGTNVLYGTATYAGPRTSVANPVSAGILDRAIRQLMRQDAKMVSKMLAGTDKVGTTPVRPAYVAFCHPDLQLGLEQVAGYKSASEYSNSSALLGDNELGAYKNIRFLASTLYTPFLAGGASGSTNLTNGAAGTGNADVYPIVIVGADSYGTISLAGADAVHPIVINPGKPSDSDPLGQRGHVGFKMYSTATMLNDAWAVRAEVAVAA